MWMKNITNISFEAQRLLYLSPGVNAQNLYFFSQSAFLCSQKNVEYFPCTTLTEYFFIM